MKRARLILLLLAPAGPLPALLPHDPWPGWKTFQSRHFEIHAHEGMEGRGQELASLCEHEFDRLQRFFRFAPSSRIHVILTDETDEANGSATPFPRNLTILIAAPPEAQLGADEFDDWMRYLVAHELTHIFQLDRARGFPGFMRRVLGRFPLFFPNIFQPLWMVEGLATWAETDRDTRVGRGQSSYFRALMRLELLRGLRPLRMVNQPLARWPAGTTRYLYGVYFMNFLEARYGKDSLRAWVAHYSNDAIPWLINRNARKAFGKNLDGLWAEFTLWLHSEFDAEIRSVQSAGLRGAKAAGPDTGAYFWGPMRGPYAVRQDGKSQARLQKLENGAWKDLAELNSARFSVGSKRILAIERGWIRQSRFSSDLVEIDPSNGAKRRLSRGLRIREAVDMTFGIAAAASHLGQKRLLLLDAAGSVQDTLWQGSEGENLSSLAASPDGKRLLASLWRGGRGWDLVEFDFEARLWKELVGRNEQELNPAWDLGGQGVFFSADYGGTYNIWRLNLQDGKIEQQTRVLGGAFQPSPLDAKTLNFSLLTADGFERGELALESPAGSPPPPERDPAQPPSPVPPSPAIESAYSPLATLWPSWWFPFGASSAGGTYVGIQTASADILQRHQLTLSLVAGLQPIADVFGEIQYAYTRFLPALRGGFSRMPSVEFDPQSHIVRQRVSEAWTAGLELPYATAWRQFGLMGTASGRRAWDYWRKPAPAPQGESRDTLFYGRLWYDGTRKYARSIGASGGLAASLSYSRVNPMLDQDGAWTEWQLSRPFAVTGLHILELNLDGGSVGQGDLEFSLAKSPAALSGQRFRPVFTLAGYPSGQSGLNGKSVGRAQLAWRFPVAEVERGFMAPPVGVDKVYGRFIAESGQAFDINGASAGPKSSLALEFNATLVLGYVAGLETSLGVAQGLDPGGETEFYLKLGSYRSGSLPGLPKAQDTFE